MAASESYTGGGDGVTLAVGSRIEAKERVLGLKHIIWLWLALVAVSYLSPSKKTAIMFCVFVLTRVLSSFMSSV
jgi:hypothetical protein